MTEVRVSVSLMPGCLWAAWSSQKILTLLFPFLKLCSGQVLPLCDGQGSACILPATGLPLIQETTASQSSKPSQSGKTAGRSHAQACLLGWDWVRR